MMFAHASECFEKENCNLSDSVVLAWKDRSKRTRGRNSSGKFVRTCLLVVDGPRHVKAIEEESFGTQSCFDSLTILAKCINTSEQYNAAALILERRKSRDPISRPFLKFHIGEAIIYMFGSPIRNSPLNQKETGKSRPQGMCSYTSEINLKL